MPAKHQHQTLHHNSLGMVSQCPCCNEIQIRLGNLFTYMPVGEFVKMVRCMERIGDKREHHLTVLPDGSNVMLIRTPVTNVLITLSPFEFEDALDLLNSSWCMLQAEAALDSTQSS